MIIKMRYPYNPSSKKTIQVFVYECTNYRVDTINKQDTPELFERYFKSDTINYTVPVGLHIETGYNLQKHIDDMRFFTLLHMYFGKEEVCTPLLLMDCEVWVTNSQGETVDKIFVYDQRSK